MTKRKTDDWYPSPIPGFDVLKWKDETQAAILRETAGMTEDELSERSRRTTEWWEKKRAKRQTAKSKK